MVGQGRYMQQQRLKERILTLFELRFEATSASFGALPVEFRGALRTFLLCVAQCKLANHRAPDYEAVPINIGHIPFVPCLGEEEEEEALFIFIYLFFIPKT